jgi:titin
LAGTLTATLVSGVATFNDLALSGPGNVNYTLTYTLSGFTATTESLRLAAGAPHHISLTRSASGFYNGSAFVTQPQITIFDKTNNVITNFTSNVTATLSSGASLVGTPVVSAASGVATYTNLGITGTSGTTYVLTFAISGLTPVTQSITVEAGAPLTPLPGIVTATPDGFTFQITNFTNLFRWELRITSGTVNAALAISPSGLVTVSSIPSGASATVSISTSRAGYQNGTYSVTGSALQPAIRAAFGALVQTSSGFKAQILNYDSLYNWSVSATNGASATISSAGMVTVTGLPAGATSVATVTSTRANYSSVSSQISGSSAGSGGTVATDISSNLATGKAVTPICAGVASSLEGVSNINDLRSSTKYLCFLNSDRVNTSYVRNSAGLMISGMNNSVVTGIQFTSGDADASRDPVVFSLFGCSLDGTVCKTLVTNGKTNLNETRNSSGSVQNFRNTTAFPAMIILFGSLRNTWTDAMQIAEITLTGSASQASAITPSFGSITPTASGFDFSISNFDSRLNWTGTGPSGVAVSVSSTGIARVTGIRPGESATVTISSSGVDRATGTASITGNALLGGLIPNLSTATPTADGFSVSITNYSSLYSWTAVVDTGTATITPINSSSATLVVAGQSAGGSTFTKVQTSRSGYADGVSYIRSTTNNPGLVPLLGASIQTLNGFKVQITNYDPAYSWSAVSTAGILAISATGLITVTGMSSGSTATLSVTSSREGYFDVVSTTRGVAAIGNAITPKFGLTKSTANGFTVQITNFDTSFAWVGVGTNSETVTISGTGLVTVTGVATQSNATINISVSKSGYITGAASISATAVPEQSQALAGNDVSISMPISATSGVSDVTVKIDIPVDAAPASTVFSTGAVATDAVDSGLRTITIDAVNGSSAVTNLNTPISITLPASSGTGVPVYSPDGVNFVEIPQLSSLLLPDGQTMGYYRYADGSIVIISRSL